MTAEETREVRLARAEAANARIAVDALPTIQARAEAAVAAAEARLAAAQAELTRVVNEEIPAGHARLAAAEDQVAALEQLGG